MDGKGKTEDGALVRRAREGDGDAFSRLVERYMKPAYAVALSVTKSSADAEDVAQEALVVALERLEECRRPEKFGSWFLTIVRNRARNLLRRENLRSTEPIPESASSDLAGPAREAERSELRRLLLDAMGELTEVQREVLLLHDLEGWKHREIAERLDLPTGTVRSHLHYARKAMRTILSSTIFQGKAREEGV